MAVKTLDDLLAEGVSSRGVLVRSDLNVPLDADGNITDPGHIIASVPTLQALSNAGAKVVVAAHLGPPEGRSGPRRSRLAPLANRRTGTPCAPWPTSTPWRRRRRRTCRTLPKAKSRTPSASAGTGHTPPTDRSIGTLACKDPFHRSTGERQMIERSGCIVGHHRLLGLNSPRLIRREGSPNTEIPRLTSTLGHRPSITQPTLTYEDADLSS